ncbi:hypothetical protein [uncultured phage]|nr:hypothetical protein [uncultured phage]CAD8327854.1 hypothetical protein [uncultured phage]CAD8327857.1 hypothetical protein [uncultured phage]
MEYVIELLQKKLNQELTALESANQMLKGKGFIMNEDTQKAFEESRRLAFIRIPQLKEAIELLTFKSE